MLVVVAPLWKPTVRSRVPPPLLIWIRKDAVEIPAMATGVARVVVCGPVWSTAVSQFGWIPLSSPFATASN